MQILPTRSEVSAALPGLAFVVLPLIVVSEAIYWVELGYVTSTFHVPAPMIALMIAAVMSIVITNVVNLPARFSPGLQFSTRWLLRAGIVLYGVNFSYSLWLRPGSQWILLIGVVAVALPLLAAYAIGRLLKLDEHTSLLVAVGTAVCGISAVVATQQAIKSDDEAAGMSLATILLFGTLVLFAYPVIDRLLGLSSLVYGIWTGATTLDLPQLVAAALQGGGSSSLLAGLWVKSIRIGLLVPVILILVGLTSRSAARGGAGGGGGYAKALRSFPLFILLFFAVILYNTVLPVPVQVAAPLATGKGVLLGMNAASILLTAAIIGICFRVRRDVLGKTGWRAVATGGIAWAFQSLLVFWLATYLSLPHI